MLRVLRQGQRWLVSIVVLGVGGVFVFFMGWGAPSGRSTSGAVVQVGPYRYGLREFERERRTRLEQIQQAAGDEFDADALADAIDDVTAQSLIQRAILALDAEAMGLTVGKREIERVVLNSDGFRDASGRFDAEAFANWAEYEYGNQYNFMAEQRSIMLAAKMARLIRGLAFVSDVEARRALRRRMEEVQIAFVVLDGARPPEDAGIDDARIDAFMAEREPEAQAFYSDNSERYNTPERVRARHVLLRAERGTEESQREEVRRRAEEVRARLAGGESFADVARELSDDPGSRDKGGDLGFFARGQMVKPFEDAAFALEPGGLSEVVETDFGFHVIRSEEYRAAEHRDYEEVRREIARELIGREIARQRAEARAEELAAAVRGGQSLEDAARARGLTLERSGWLKRRPDGFVPGLGAAQDLLATAFGMQPGESSARVFRVGEKLALVQTLAQQEPDPASIEVELANERRTLLEQERENHLRTWITDRRAELLERGELVVDLASR